MQTKRIKGGRSYLPYVYAEQGIIALAGVLRSGLADKMAVVQVMLDSDIAALFQVDVKRLNEQRKRNPDRFPKDFCFQLTKEERDCLRSQIATFTERTRDRK